MKKLAVSLIPFFLILMTSCNENETIADYPFLLKKDENITLLFSDDNFINEEGNYYDALLDVKKKYPEKVRSFNIIHSSDSNLTEHYQITRFPTLVVIHNEEIILRIEGALNNEEIFQLLEQTLLTSQLN